MPAPLQPDYSSESNDSSADSDTQANPDPQEVDPFTEPRKMSIIELSEAIKTMDGRAVKGSETSEEDLDDQAKEPWEGEKKAVQKDLGTEETDCLSYCEIMIEPDVKGQLRAKRPTPTETRRPESMIYTEVITGPLWEGLKTPARQPTKTETSEEEPAKAESVHVKTDLKQKTITEKDEDGDVYYLQLLGEDEVIYDLMYASGQGSIQFWPPQSPPSDHDAPQDMLSLTEASESCFYSVYLLALLLSVPVAPCACNLHVQCIQYVCYMLFFCVFFSWFHIRWLSHLLIVNFTRLSAAVSRDVIGTVTDRCEMLD